MTPQKPTVCMPSCKVHSCTSLFFNNRYYRLIKAQFIHMYPVADKQISQRTIRTTGTSQLAKQRSYNCGDDNRCVSSEWWGILTPKQKPQMQTTSIYKHSLASMYKRTADPEKLVIALHTSRPSPFQPGHRRTRSRLPAIHVSRHIIGIRWRCLIMKVTRVQRVVCILCK